MVPVVREFVRELRGVLLVVLVWAGALDSLV